MSLATSVLSLLVREDYDHYTTAEFCDILESTVQFMQTNHTGHNSTYALSKFLDPRDAQDFTQLLWEWVQSLPENFQVIDISIEQLLQAADSCLQQEVWVFNANYVLDSHSSQVSSPLAVRIYHYCRYGSRLDMETAKEASVNHIHHFRSRECHDIVGDRRPHAHVILRTATYLWSHSSSLLLVRFALGKIVQLILIILMTRHTVRGLGR
jgi:hypothetical protein